MYLWIKAFHLISVVAWFAGLFYIFRLFVYHVKHKENQSLCEVFQVMETKLIRFIIHPAMGVSIILGLVMIHLNSELLHQGWLHAKLTFVALLIGYQVYGSYVRKNFARGNFILTEKQCRLINEVPTVLLIVIVCLAVLKPF